MVEQLGGPAAKLNKLNWVLEIHMEEGGTNSRRLSSDLHMQPWHIYAHICTHTERER